MKQVEFANNVKRILETDDSVTGLAVGGSWLNSQMDEFSDLDLIIVTETKVSDDKNKMFDYAGRFGDFLSGFTGEHVGEPRLLICLYDNPLLHVDLKFVTIAEFQKRIETPAILLDKGGKLKAALENSTAEFPYPDYQWIEDRFWIWVHYALLKIGRGEYFETLDFFSFIRIMILGPLLHIKNGNLPRGVRKAETELTPEDLSDLKVTIPDYERHSLLESLRYSISLYRKLRSALFDDRVKLQKETEAKVMQYLDEIEKM